MSEKMAMSGKMEEAEFTRLLESSGNVVFKYQLHPERAFLYVSDNVETLFGYSVEEHLKNPDLPLQCVHEDDMTGLKSVATGKAQATESLPSSLKPLALRWRRKDGQLRHTLLSLFPVTKDEKRVAFYGLHADITDQLERSYELETKARRLETLAAHATGVSWACTMDLRLTHASSALAELIGVEENLLTKRDLNGLLTPSSRDLLRDMLEKLRLAHCGRTARSGVFGSAGRFAEPAHARLLPLRFQRTAHGDDGLGRHLRRAPK